MKSDQQLRYDVMAALACDRSVDSRRIGVSAKGGVVTLSGTLDTFLEKRNAERAALGVPGVRRVEMELAVKLLPGHRRSDAEIAEAALAALCWHTEVPRERVFVTVEDGQVRLTGEVDGPSQAQTAERCVSHLAGVQGVINQLTLGHRQAA